LGSVPVILVDTHILSAGVHRDERLPARLTAYLERQKRVTLRESAILCWEVANLVERGRPTKVS
jgi:PIN domain nuclease of toxin-antitoxin system